MKVNIASFISQDGAPLSFDLDTEKPPVVHVNSGQHGQAWGIGQVALADLAKMLATWLPVQKSPAMFSQGIVPIYENNQLVASLRMATDHQLVFSNPVVSSVIVLSWVDHERDPELFFADTQNLQNLAFRLSAHEAVTRRAAAQQTTSTD